MSILLDFLNALSIHGFVDQCNFCIPFLFPKHPKHPKTFVGVSDSLSVLKRLWMCLDLLWKNNLCVFLSSMIAFAPINIFSFDLAYTFYGNIPCGSLLPNLSAISFIDLYILMKYYQQANKVDLLYGSFLSIWFFAFFWSSLLLKHLIYVIHVFHSKIKWHHIRQVHWLSWSFMNFDQNSKIPRQK